MQVLRNSYVYLGFSHQLTPEFAERSAEDAVNKALELDDSIGEAHDTLGVLNWRYKGNWTLPNGSSTAQLRSLRATAALMKIAPFISGLRAGVARLFRNSPRAGSWILSPSFALTESATYF